MYSPPGYTSYQPLFSLHLFIKVKKMINLYNSSYLISKALAKVTAISLLYRNVNDKTVPSINIMHPVANDTIHLTNGSVTIKVMLKDIANIKEMEMDIKSRSGSILFSDKEDAIENQNYTCIENFYPAGITKKTRMKLCVSFKNDFENWKTKKIIFYVIP